MKIVSISDVHIKTSDDERAELLFRFFNTEDVKNADQVFLLGDIFDLMVGNKPQYVDKYSKFFNKIKELLVSGKIIHYFEGNHDFHVKNLINDWSREIDQADSMFFHKKAIVKKIGDRKILFTHGDDIEIDNPSYKIYKTLINNKLLEFLGDHVVPYSFIEWIGHRASKKSRERNKQRYEKTKDDSAMIRDRFREAARRASKKYDVCTVVCGHSHVKDNFKEGSLTYLNSGYAPIEQSYIVLETGKEPEIKKIT